MGKKREWNQMRRASFTIEAAGLMPVILLAIFGMLALGIHVYHRAWLTGAACEAALSGSMSGLHQDYMIQQTAGNKAQTLAEEVYPPVRQLQISCTGTRSVRVTYTFTTMEASFGLSWNAEASAVSRRIQPSLRLRERKDRES